jgi:hypothetical protein
MLNPTIYYMMKNRMENKENPQNLFIECYNNLKFIYKESKKMRSNILEAISTGKKLDNHFNLIDDKK